MSSSGPQSLNPQRDNRGALTCTLRAAPKKSLFSDHGGTTVKTTAVRVFDRAVEINDRRFDRDTVDRVFVSGVGPMLVIERGGQQTRIDASGHPLADVEWLAFRMAAALNPKVSMAKPTLDGLEVTMVALDEAVVASRARGTHLMLALAGLAALAVGVGEGVAVPMAVTVLLLWALQALDMSQLGWLALLHRQPAEVTVSVGPRVLRVGHREVSWSKVLQARLDDRGQRIIVECHDDAIELEARPGAPPRELETTYRTISASIEAFHGGSAREDEQLAREAIGALKKGATAKPEEA